jgi:hypothetical protein
MNKTAFEPRIGFAWKVLGSDKTVVRGGYSIYHDSAWSMGAQGLWQNPPFFAEGDNFGLAENSGITFGPNSPVGCPTSTSFCAGSNFNVTGVTTTQGFPIFNSPPSLSTFTGTLYFQPRNFKLGLAQQFNVNVERQLPGNLVLTLGYAGARGEHILVAGNNLNTNSSLNANGIGPTNCGVGGYTLGCNANGTPFVSTIGVGNTVLEFGDLGRTKYDSMQIKVETKSSRYGLYALIGYTYSQTYDNGLSDGLGSLLSAPYFPLPNWPKLDWAPSQIALDHNFTASVIYDLPFGKGKRFANYGNGAMNTLVGGWQLTLIEKISSGFPDPLIDSANGSGVAFNAGGNGNNFNRPNQVAGCDPYAANHGANQWINPACFVAPPQGELGNASRVPVTGPGFVNTDFSILKQFALPWENVGLNFRAEFFNLFNHPQFGQPNINVFTQGAAGACTATGFGCGSLSSQAGQITTLGGNTAARQIQFGLKFLF